MRRALWTNSEEWNRRYLLEDHSTSTAENFAFSKALLEEQDIDTYTAVIGVVTNDFHMFRAKLIAQREGLTTVGVPAELLDTAQEARDGCPVSAISLSD